MVLLCEIGRKWEKTLGIKGNRELRSGERPSNREDTAEIGTADWYGPVARASLPQCKSSGTLCRTNSYCCRCASWPIPDQPLFLAQDQQFSASACTACWLQLHDFMSIFHFVHTACPTHCTSCRWGPGQAGTQCSGDRACLPGYGLDNNYQCSGIHMCYKHATYRSANGIYCFLLSYFAALLQVIELDRNVYV